MNAGYGVKIVGGKDGIGLEYYNMWTHGERICRGKRTLEKCA